MQQLYFQVLYFYEKWVIYCQFIHTFIFVSKKKNQGHEIICNCLHFCIYQH